METKNYLQDIAHIKTMMSRSSRFMSISGLSGILAGIYALVGAALAYLLLNTYPQYDYYDRTILADDLGSDLFSQLLGIAILVLAAALVTGAILTYRKAKKLKEDIWNPVSKRLLANFAVPLITGGFFCLVLLQYGIVGLVAPATLIFYGLALINASKFTVGDIKYLGLANVLIGLVATQFVGYGLYFWALGFGVFHIIYGAIMYHKYDRPTPNPSQRVGK